MQRADDGSVRADSPTTSVNLFFKNAVRALFFCARNESIPAERSHYDARNMLVSWDGVGLPSPSLPIVRTLSIFYGKVGKFEKMPLDHFSQVEPYLHGNRSGVTPGLAMLSFANDIRTPPPNGHINFSNLAEVSVQFEETTEVTRIKDGGVLSPADLTPMTTPTTTTPTTTDAPPALDLRPPFPPNWRYTCAVYALTNNIIEISRGTIKFLF
jgi:hypothetical protein